ncbi:3-deoxy-manno-octulosonate cytidylyltransferase [Reichenbachiella sp. 5M10]|uniref:3-deoxy-manno-octulosonate cytidylyltransferase n=1 Tax=Reichenbachiella sp. 5M10 TaxID=1889772 RepID=UPI000C1500A5|nr:3-deoxy-manno-octulosonate cytidylyltransferase [Reichenbachiella sp. 5M10]PIB37133.1 3-deoxy-manno-octulosonate cytidylyltransferase [Reichenbachiella sp. 5M10]
MRLVIIIPARLKSTRLPEKPLIDLCGKSMIQRTYERCTEVLDASDVYVATDSQKIQEHCKQRDINVLMTAEDCLTGTDRVAEAAKQVDADYYINVQGDEPIISPDDIRKIISNLSKYPGMILNGYAEIKKEDEYRSLSIPKVVFTANGNLMYMSRSPIPGNKKNEFNSAYKQICIYAFPKGILEKFARANDKSFLEGIEDIEILRFVEMGDSVQMIELLGDSIAVDTPEDVNKVLEKIGRGA